MIESIFKTLHSVGFFHPLHPSATHLPMGLVMAGFIFVFAGVFFKKPALFETAYNCSVLALIFLPLTALFGYMDWQFTINGQWIFAIKLKMFLAVALAIMLLIILKIGKKQQDKPLALLILYAIPLIIVINLGYQGGGLVFG